MDLASMRSYLTPARISVIRVAGDKEMTDQQVLNTLQNQLLRGNLELEISVKATEAQVDKAMQKLMSHVVGRREIEQIKKMSGVR